MLDPGTQSIVIGAVVGGLVGGIFGYLGGLQGGRESARGTLMASINEAERDRRSRLVDPVIEEGKDRLLAFRQIVEASSEFRKRQRVDSMFEAMSAVHRQAPTEERLVIENPQFEGLVMNYQFADRDCYTALYMAIERQQMAGLDAQLKPHLEKVQTALSQLEATGSAFVVGRSAH